MEDTQFSNYEVLILGAGGLAREIVSWHNCSKNKVDFKIVGFLDDNLHALDNYNTDIKILNKLDLKHLNKKQSAINAISDVVTKNNILQQAEILDIEIRSYFHPSCLIGDRTFIGKGLVILPYAIISCDVKIGDLVLINSGSQIGHDVSIGNYTSIMANVDVGGGAIIGDNVFIGSNATILPGVKIPDNTRIGAGAVVLKNIKKPGTYFGNPSKQIF